MRGLRAGYSIVEVMVVVAIIAVVAALTFPMLSGSVRSAKAATTKTKLRQIFYSLELYRQEYDAGYVGDLGDLGLPSIQIILKGANPHLGLPIETWKSDCTPHPKGIPSYRALYYYPGEGGADLIENTFKMEENYILIGDDQCNLPSVNIENPFETKTGFGVASNGTLYVRKGRGRVMDTDWWIRTLNIGRR